MGESFAADLAACRSLLRGGSRSFYAASLLLPGRVRRPATALYAFCRIADDLIDHGDPVPALAQLHRRLDAIYAGRPAPDPADRALAVVVERCGIPRLLLDRLLEGFGWDAEGRRYEDLPALEAYAARVAGTVGAMMAVVMGVREAETLARACDLGVAMQLTNIARDVGEDARAGRLYLPLSWMREAGLDPETWLARPAANPALGQVVARLLREADRLYARADAGVAALPLDCRPGIGTARRLYAEIGHAVASGGFDSVTVRARVGLARKLGLAGRSLLAAPFPVAGSGAPPLDATRELVAVAVAANLLPRPGLGERLIWLLTLFGELNHRQARGG
ncbi:MAG: phytoene/squalene synthase family protein [Acetobacteraceae bacterium]